MTYLEREIMAHYRLGYEIGSIAHVLQMSIAEVEAVIAKNKENGGV